MKKLMIAFLILLFAVPCMARDTIHKVDGETQYITQILELSADASAVDLGANLCGGYLFGIEIYASADDAMTFSISSRNGTVFYTTTTTAATSGQVENPTGMWMMNCDANSTNDYPTYTLSGLGSGTVIIEVTVAKR